MNQQILVVDDEPENLKVLGNLLNEKGYSSLFADSGEQALNVLKDEKAHLILLDISPKNRADEPAMGLSRTHRLLISSFTWDYQ